MNSPAIAISVAPNTAKAKSKDGESGAPDDKAFSISLEVAREEAEGEAASPDAIAQSLANGGTSTSGAPAGDDDTLSISVTVSEDEATGATEMTNITIDGLTTDDVGGEGAGDDALSISVTVSDDQTSGDAETTSITIEGLSMDGGVDTDGDLTIEIETISFTGDELAASLSASTVLGGGAVAETADGSFGVNGSVSGSADIRLEIGETLTFELPKIEDGEVVGGQVTITNLFSDGNRREGALIFAYDSDDKQLAVYTAIGNETGTVAVDIDVSFSRLDFKALDNDSWFLKENSNFAVGDIGVNIASFMSDVMDGASDVVSDLLAYGNKIQNADLLDVTQFGTVNFEIGRISVNKQLAIGSLSSVDADLERDQERLRDGGLERGPAHQPDLQSRQPGQIERDRVTS